MPTTATLRNGTKTRIIAILDERYDLGPFVDACKICGGTVNTSYRIKTKGAKNPTCFFLREYNPHILECEIVFEHALLGHLRRKGFDLATVAIEDRRGATYFAAPASDPSAEDNTFWSLFEYLDGEDKYSWTDTLLTEQEFASSAEILARLHHHAVAFKPPAGAKRIQPAIMDFVPTIGTKFQSFASKARQRRCDQLLKSHIDRIESLIQQSSRDRPKFMGMPWIPIHCDYHPGNLKYRNEKGVAVFDFDWSKFDYRLFDVALALVYFCARWEGAQAGSLRLRPLRRFLHAYLKACRRLQNIHPLSSHEYNCLIPMLSYANLYVLNWSVTDFYEKIDADDGEYHRYFKHGIRLMKWIDGHHEDIKNVLDTIQDKETR